MVVQEQQSLQREEQRKPLHEENEEQGNPLIRSREQEASPSATKPSLAPANQAGEAAPGAETSAHDAPSLIMPDSKPVPDVGERDAEGSSISSSGDGNADDGDDENSHKQPAHQSPLTTRMRSSFFAIDGRGPIAMIQMARIHVGAIVNHEWVQWGILAIIAFNSFMMGLETFSFIEENENASHAFSVIDRACLVVFTVEVSLQFFYRGLYFFMDAWLVFDIGIVVLSWVFEGELQIVRAFRIFRAVRLFTRFKPLRNLVTALAEVSTAASAICFLLTLIVYIYAVLFTELFSDLELSQPYFKTLDASLFTCIELITMDNWGELSREVMKYKSWAWAPITIFIGQTSLIIANIFVAVICDAVSVADEKLRHFDLGIRRTDSSGELTYTPKSPWEELAETQERVDAVQRHVDDMVASQQQVLTMLDNLGTELARLRAQRLASNDREAQLRIELEAKREYERNMMKSDTMILASPISSRKSVMARQNSLRSLRSRESHVSDSRSSHSKSDRGSGNGKGGQKFSGLGLNVTTRKPTRLKRRSSHSPKRNDGGRKLSLSNFLDRSEHIRPRERGRSRHSGNSVSPKRDSDNSSQGPGLRRTSGSRRHLLDRDSHASRSSRDSGSAAPPPPPGANNRRSFYREYSRSTQGDESAGSLVGIE